MGVVMAQRPAELEHFSDLLLTLAKTITKAPLEHVLHEALALLRELVPFRSAWWGEAIIDGVTGVPRVWTHDAIGLSSTFAREWAQIAQVDAFAKFSLSNPGATVLSLDEHREGAPLIQAVEEFCSRHQIAYSMAVSHELPSNGPLFFCSINRDSAGVPFSESEQAAFSCFCKHVHHYWKERVELERSSNGAGVSEDYAIAGSRGQLIYLGGRVATVLDREIPEWGGTWLPPQFTDLNSNVSKQISVGRSTRFALERRGACVLLRLVERTSTSGLPPRESEAASLYAQGRSSKEIAVILGLSPATVRTYLRNAYQHLGVRNKIQLMTKLSSGQAEMGYDLVHA